MVGDEMARKRMIDPNIWQSEDFSKLKTLSKLVFIGLFSNADDYGYGRAKAAYIKSILFPYDEDIRTTDIEKSLDEIAANMSIVFYRSGNGNEYYSLKNWSKWQKVDKPSASIIPPIDDNSEIIRGTVREHSENVQETVPPNKNKKRIEKEKNITLSDDNVCRTDVQRIAEKWNELESVGIKAVSRISSGTIRYDSLTARIKEYGIDKVLTAIEKIKSSDFLCGKGGKGWVITFDWFVKPNNFIKVLEGNYDNKQDDGLGNGLENKGSVITPPKGVFNNYNQKVYSEEEIQEILRRKNNV